MLREKKKQAEAKANVLPIIERYYTSKSLGTWRQGLSIPEMPDMSLNNMWEMGAKEVGSHPRRKEQHAKGKEKDGVTEELQVVWCI